MSTTLTAYRVFIASPGGLIPERKAFREVIAHYNECEAVQRGTYFIPVGWEITLGGVGRPQGMINEEVRACDYFVLLLWDRWGTPTDSAPNPKYTSGTEEEYYVAWECFENNDKAMRQIIVFFKAVDPSRLNDPGPQLTKVLDFRKSVEHEKKLLFDTFDEIDSFKDRLRAYLAQWLRDHEQGKTAKVKNPEPIAPPSGAEHGITLPTEQPSESVASPNKTLLEEAQHSANEGNLTDAEVKFAKAVARGDDPDALKQYGDFLIRTGRLGQAQVMFERMLELSSLPDDQDWQAKAYNGLGRIAHTRGDLDQAEAMLRKALEFFEKLGRPEGTANQYGNLGNIYFTRGDLDQAEAMYRKSLEINEKLGRLEGMADQYGNLGLIHQTRGDLDQAEAMLRKALEINEKLGRLEGMAISYCNLGLIYKKRGILGRAEAMHHKALQIEQNLGNLEGVASESGNLGVIYGMRGDLAQAEAMFHKALLIDEQLGRLEEKAGDYGNLGLIHQKRGNLEQAEAMHRKALEIFEKLGRLEKVAGEYGNLGLIHQKRGNLEQAEAMHRKALEINEKLGRMEGVANSYGNLGSVYEQRGDRTKARECWTKAKELYNRGQMPHKAKQMEEWIAGLK